MGIFQDAQWKLNSQSVVGSGSLEILWLYSLPARLKKIQSELKGIDCHQHNNLICRLSSAAINVISGGIGPKFKLIQAFMHVFVTCKNEEDPIKNEGAIMATTFLLL